MRQRWQLMMLDARALADIGIDRADAETECPITARSKRLCPSDARVQVDEDGLRHAQTLGGDADDP